MAVELNLVLVLLVIFISSLIRASFGFGNALLAMPLLALLMPIETAVPLIALVSTVIAALLLLGDWRHVELRTAGRLILPAFISTPLGIYFLRHGNERDLQAVLAVIILAFSGFCLLRPNPPALKTDGTAWLFGLCSGVLGGAYNVNGPPLVIYATLRRWPPERFRATLQGFFLPVSLFTACAHGVAGLWNESVAHHFVLALPVVMASVWLGNRIGRLFPEESFNRWVYVLLILLSILLLIESRSR